MDISTFARTLLLLYSLQYPSYVESIFDGDHRLAKDTEGLKFVVYIGSKHYIPSKKSKYYIHCLGVVITKRHVLSMHQCIKDSKKQRKTLQVFGGSREIHKCDSYDVDRVVAHNDWLEEKAQPPVFEYLNSAILTLKDELNGWRIERVFVPKRNEEFFGTSVLGVGFNTKVRGQTRTYTLHVADLTLLSKTDCESKLNDARDAKGTLLCSHWPPRMTTKDSGSPILYTTDTLVGINIVSQGSWKKRQENLHVNFNFFRDFVESHIQGEQLRMK